MNDVKRDVASLGQKRKNIRNHVRMLLREIERSDSWVNANNLTTQTKKIVDQSRIFFPVKDISIYLLPFDDDYIYNLSPDYNQDEGMTRIVQIRMALSALNDYFNSMLGDPTAQENIDDNLAQASEVLNDEGHKCAPLLASLLIRLSIEQTLKTLCNLNNIEYAHKEKARSLDEKLRKNGIYPEYKSRDVQAKLALLNAVVHGDADPPPIGEIHKALDWTNRFISEYLPGPVGQIDSD